MFKKFLEQSLGVIPVIGKKPAIAEWQRYCDELPSEAQANFWENHFKNSNYGLPLGRANNIIALDIDSDNKEVKALAPPSPVIKAGMVGETRFFQFNPEISNLKLGRSKQDPLGIVEVLSTGRQTVIPPSIHPDTQKPYIWLTADTLPDFKDLPTLTHEMLAPLMKLFSGSSKISVLENREEGRLAPSGAQAQMVKIGSYLAANDTPAHEAVAELLKRDQELHKPVGYFFETGRTSDQKRGGGSPEKAALLFYQSICKSLKKPLPTADSKPLIVLTKKPYPKGRGFIGKFQEACLIRSDFDASPLGLGGGLALMSILCANKFASKFQGSPITPNLYVLNVASSGVGKDVPQKFASQILEGTSLFGASAYRSATSILQGLPKKQERLDVIDEAASFFSAMVKGGTHQTEIPDVLCKLFSSAATSYSGICSAMNKDVLIGACYQPHLSLLCSITPTGLRESVKIGLQKTGLMPRFLIFCHPEIDGSSFKAKDLKGYQDPIDDLKKEAEQWLNKPKITDIDQNPNILQSYGLKYKPTQIPLTEEAEDFAINFYAEVKRGIKDFEAFDSAFKNRWVEIALKIALLDAVSSGQDTIELLNVQWAKDVVEACWEHSKDLLLLASAENLSDEWVIRVEQKIKKNPGMKKSELRRACRFIPFGTRVFEDILNNLVESGHVERRIQLSGQNNQETQFFY